MRTWNPRTREIGVANEDGVFLLVGAYASVDDAQADYEVVKELHANKVIGGFDAAVITLLAWSSLTTS